MNHEFDWENVEILDKEPSYKKKSMSEMLHIKKQVLGLNKQSDTELLSDAYLPILDRMSPPSVRYPFSLITFVRPDEAFPFRSLLFVSVLPKM